jgi:hypothetical protein
MLFDGMKHVLKCSKCGGKQLGMTGSSTPKARCRRAAVGDLGISYPYSFNV